jgi:hypothetical protein
MTRCQAVLHSAATVVSLLLRPIPGGYGWLFLINNQKENRRDSSTQKFAEPIYPEIRPVTHIVLSLLIQVGNLPAHQAPKELHNVKTCYFGYRL